MITHPFKIQSNQYYPVTDQSIPLVWFDWLVIGSIIRWQLFVLVSFLRLTGRFQHVSIKMNTWAIAKYKQALFPFYYKIKFWYTNYVNIINAYGVCCWIPEWFQFVDCSCLVIMPQSLFSVIFIFCDIDLCSWLKVR